MFEKFEPRPVHNLRHPDKLWKVMVNGEEQSRFYDKATAEREASRVSGTITIDTP